MTRTNTVVVDSDTGEQHEVVVTIRTEPGLSATHSSPAEPPTWEVVLLVHVNDGVWVPQSAIDAAIAAAVYDGRFDRDEL